MAQEAVGSSALSERALQRNLAAKSNPSSPARPPACANKIKSFPFKMGCGAHSPRGFGTGALWRLSLSGFETIEAGAEIRDFGTKLLQRFGKGFGKTVVGHGPGGAVGGRGTPRRLQPALGGLFQHLGSQGGAGEDG